MNLKQNSRNRISEAEWLFFFLGFLFIWLMSARTPVDTDLWWHLRAGEQVLQTRQAVLTDPFSFTRLGQPWVNHSWLFEVLLALAYRVGGYMGLGGLVSLGAVLSMMIVYRQMQGPGLLKLALLIVGALVAAPLWATRPQLFSLVLLALTMAILRAEKAGDQKKVRWLPLVFILWSNLHPGYALGILLIVATLAGEVLNHWQKNPPQQTRSWAQIRNLAIWGGVSCLAVLINPNGLNMWTTLWNTVHVKTLQELIPEWASPNFHDVVQQPFLLLLALWMVGMGLTKRRVDWPEVLPVVGFGAMALMARRNFGALALVALPPLSVMCGHLAEGVVLPRSKDAPAWFRKGFNLTLVFLLALACFIKWWVVTSPVMVHTAIQASYPVAAVEKMKSLPEQGPLFNSYNWGGYILWFAPDTQVFVDGRTDLYGDEILSEWLAMMEAKDGWASSFERWDIRRVLIEPQSPLVAALKNAGWKTVYQDSLSVLLVKAP